MSPLLSNMKVTLIRVGSKHSGAGKDKRAVPHLVLAHCQALGISLNPPFYMDICVLVPSVGSVCTVI